jgi:hypothetical protein
LPGIEQIDDRLRAIFGSTTPETPLTPADARALYGDLQTRLLRLAAVERAAAGALAEIAGD